MTFLPLLGKHLKDDDVIEFLEDHEVAVTYQFDRNHENDPDKYWAPSKNGGFQCGFDASQTLNVIFLYITPHEEFSPVDQRSLDVPLFASPEEIEVEAASHRHRITKGCLPKEKIAWARIDSDDSSVHYQFKDGVLNLVTLSLPRRK